MRLARPVRHRPPLLGPPSTFAGLFILAAIALGGGGGVAPLSETMLELATALMALVWLIRSRAGVRMPAIALAFAGLLVVLPLLQLVPLPPNVWQTLPGRAGEARALALVGRADAWMPVSISPARTFASLLALGPAVLALSFASALGRRGRTTLLAAIALGGLASVLLGALQLADGVDRTWRFYADNSGFLNGFQANRNAQADVMLITAAAAVATFAGLRRDIGDRRALAGAITAGAILLLGCVLTGSRAGIALIPLVAIGLALTWQGDRPGRRTLAIAALVALAPVVVLVLLLNNPAIQAVAARFTWDRDLRLDLWHDTWTAIASHWPAGSGVGTFRPAFLGAERLEMVEPTNPVRAHNDYLEFLLEGGAVAVALLTAGAGLLIVAARRALRVARGGDIAQLAFCATALVVIALHSVVDYPLRSMALACLAASAVGMLFAIGREPETRGRGECAHP